MTPLALVFAFASILAFALTPVMCRLAIRWGQVDNPDGQRKTHARPIPLAGGLAILVSSIAALFAIQSLGWSITNDGGGEQVFLIGFLISAVFICILGVIDDRFLLRGRYKLFGQLIAVLIIIASGEVIKNVNFFGTNLDLGPLAVPFTAMWLLGAINSLNLIDGMDGLLSSIGLITCLTLAFMSMALGHLSTALLAMTLAGALAGFLCFNFPPASVFLGDAGSMLVGLVIGVLSIHGSLKGHATIAFSVPIVLLTIPFFDTFAAILRRKLTGKSIYFADREHLHHCLLRRGYSSRRALLCVSCLCALTCSGALVAVLLQNESFAILTSIIAIALLISTRLFGHSELLLVRKHLSVAASSLLSPHMTGDHHAIEVRFHGSADWQVLWSKLAEAGTENELASLILDVSASAGKERYHARWASVRPKAKSIQQWQAVVPLFLDGNVAGRLHVAGRADIRPMAKQLIMLADLIDDLETSLTALLRPIEVFTESGGESAPRSGAAVVSSLEVTS